MRRYKLAAAFLVNNKVVDNKAVRLIETGYKEVCLIPRLSEDPHGTVPLRKGV